MNDTYIVFMNFTTLNAPPNPRLSIDSAFLGTLSSLMMALLASVYLMS